jgi:hypothetical protein
MNARRVPFEAPKERSRVCFGGFRPTRHVEEPRALARGAPLIQKVKLPAHRAGLPSNVSSFHIVPLDPAYPAKAGWGTFRSTRIMRTRGILYCRLFSMTHHDAASKGLNLQRLSTLINLDLPWNPTRLEQRKGRIQRIGQIHDRIYIYNLRYKDSVEDRVHALLSERLEGIYKLFGQIPDILEDVWVALALGEKDRAKKIIDELPKTHPFELRYTNVEKVEWESCRRVLNETEKKKTLLKGW